MSFEKIVRKIDALGLRLYDFALYTDGKIDAHRFQPCNHCNDSYSVAKAFTMTAIGLLWDDGKLQVTDSLYDLFRDDFPSGADERWKKTTIEHALTHRLGFEKGFLDIDQEDVNAYPTSDYLRFVLSHPLAYEPGTHYQYSDAAFYLLSRVVSRIAGENLDSLLWERLLLPMRFKEVAWSRCPMEYPIGATGLYISADDMVKLGALYMGDGMFEGKRLLSGEWVRLALNKQYEFKAMLPGSLTGKCGVYGQGLVFSKEKRFAAAWHGYVEDGSWRELIACLEEMDE